MKIKRVYIEQFGAFWSMSVADWLVIVREQIKSNNAGYTLPDAELKYRPKYIKKSETEGRYYCENQDFHFASPLKFEMDDWESELEILNNNKNLLPCGTKVLVKKCTWKSIKGIIHHVDSRGTIFTRRGDHSHTNIHLYGIKIPHGVFFTDNYNNEFKSLC